MNQKLSKGIHFRKLTYSDLEIVRTWRNKPSIHQNFINKTYISATQQKLWFEKIQKTNDIYYIVEYLEKPVAIFYLTNLDNTAKKAEPNGFIGEEKILKTHIAGKILIEFFKIAFNTLNLEELNGKILKSNHSFIDIHKKFGAEIKSLNETEYVKTSLSKKAFIIFLNLFS